MGHMPAQKGGRPTGTPLPLSQTSGKFGGLDGLAQ